MKDDYQLSRQENRLLDACDTIRQDWLSPEIDFSHSVLCSLGLPYRSQGDATSFVRRSGNSTLLLEAGSFLMPSGEVVSAGLPYGAKSRLILIFLMTEAVRRQSPTIELGMTFTHFCKSLGFGTDGRTIKRLREQVRRMSVLKMSIRTEREDYKDFSQSFVFSNFRVMSLGNEDQMNLFPDVISFSPTFYNSLNKHAVPLKHHALVALKHSARGLDLLTWLSHRLPRVGRATPIRWTSLRFQFGRTTQNMSGFRRDFKKALRQVLLVYPDANVVITKTGISLRPSKPAVRRIRG